jgi:uncharacterized alkaline shock family protein YloU
MKFLRSAVILVHTLVLLVIGGLLILLSMDIFSPDELSRILEYLGNPNVKLALAVVGAIFILGGLIMAHVNLSRIQTEKTIAFENPEGQVTVSLSAIEDYIKKSLLQLPELKELRSSVTASKKGINIVCRATIFADSNIPETTERIQSIIKSRVQEMLGVEETINIKIHVNKISSRGKSEAQPPAKEHEEASRRMPLGAAE